MEYNDFFRAFYFPRTKGAIIDYKSKAKVPEFFMMNATEKDADGVLPTSSSTYEKWLTGDRNPGANIWNSVIRHLSTPGGEAALSRALVRNLNEEYIPQVVDRLGLILSEGESIDKEMFSIAVAKQFLKIAQGSGTAENIIEKAYREDVKVDSFPTYVRESLKKYEKMKTLLYTSEEHPFDEFFVCNTVSRDAMLFRRNRRDSKNSIENADLDKLKRVASDILLVGMGGMGKSMMMRHLFLESIREYAKTGKLPIIVTLREFSQNTGDIFELIIKSVNRYDTTFTSAHLHKMMLKGKCQILLDGLDEIKYNEIPAFEIQLDRLIDRYPDNQFVMSTRQFSSFVEIPRFRVLQMLPFSLNQSLELIDKLDFCPEEPKLKAEFREKVINEYSKTHNEFISNPLLLTLMLMNFRRFSDVPEKKYLFYQQAYETLLYRHDADKLAYRRVFKSVNDPSEFTEAFREFCAKSYRRGDYEFTEEEFETYFKKLHKVEELDKNKMTVPNFLYDILHSVCLMYEEAQSYHFLHRSFQEYFFADYYSRQDDGTLRKLGRFLETANTNLFDDDAGFEMLYELDQSKTERFILLPFLDTIYTGETEIKCYENFLAMGFESIDISWIDGDLIKKYANGETARRIPGSVNEPSNVVMRFVLRQASKERYFSLNLNKPITIKDADSKWSILGSSIKFMHDPKRLFRLMKVPQGIWDHDEEAVFFSDRNDIIVDEDKNPIIFGEEYIISCNKIFTEQEKFRVVISLLKDPGLPAYQMYLSTERYYKKLKDKYARVDEMEDDDF